MAVDHRVPLGGELKAIRQRLHLTQVDLAKMLGVAGRTVWRYENQPSHGPGRMKNARALIYLAEIVRRKDALPGTLEVDASTLEAYLRGVPITSRRS
jgi:transcriptional regulator with XRE-family HTH domain